MLRRRKTLGAPDLSGGPILANYEREQAAFDALIQPECDQRILLLQGDSGTGKTTLLQACLEKVPGHVIKIPVQLRRSAVSVAEIFSRAGGKLGWERLTHFTERVDALQRHPNVLGAG